MKDNGTIRPFSVWAKHNKLTICIASFILLMLLYTCYRYSSRERVLEIHPTVMSVSDNRIPRRIHQLFTGGRDIPGVFVPWIKSWLEKHPDWEYWLWTDDDVEKLLRDKMPDSRYLDIYRRFPRFTYKTNAARYAILYFFGGFYADMDMGALKTFDDFVLGNECTLTQESLYHSEFYYNRNEPIVMTCIMGCKPRTPFIKHVMDSMYTDPIVQQCVNNPSHCNKTQHTTGPFYLTRTYKSFIKSRIDYGKSVKKNVTLLTPEYFNPTFDPNKVGLVEKACKKPKSSLQQNLCDQYHQNGNKPTSAAYADHYWFHSPSFFSQLTLRFSRSYHIMDIIPMKNLYIYSYL